MTVNNRHRASLRRLPTDIAPGTLGKHRIGASIGDRQQAAAERAKADAPAQGFGDRINTKLRDFFGLKPRDVQRFASRSQFVDRKPETGLARLGNGGTATTPMATQPEDPLADTHLGFLDTFLGNPSDKNTSS